MTETSAQPTGTGAGTRAAPSTTWSTGFATFAGVILLVTGVCQVLVGVAALFRDTLYVATPGYIYSFDVTAWGWTHLILGAAVALTGLGVLQGQTWARMVGVGLASLSLIANFLFLPHNPLWALVVIALDVVVIAALARELRATA